MCQIGKIFNFLYRILPLQPHASNAAHVTNPLHLGTILPVNYVSLLVSICKLVGGSRLMNSFNSVATNLILFTLHLYFLLRLRFYIGMD